MFPSKPSGNFVFLLEKGFTLTLQIMNETCSNVLITYFLLFLLKVPRGPLRKYKQWTYSTYKRYKKIT